MRPWLVGFAFLLLTLPAAAENPAPALPALEAGASCPVDPAGGDSGTSLLEEIGLPTPTPVACEPNFCSISRDYCESLCAPCGIDFSCKGRTCESICTCSC